MPDTIRLCDRPELLADIDAPLKLEFHLSFADGGEIFFGGTADHWNVPVFDIGPAGRYNKRCLYAENPFASKDIEAAHERMDARGVQRGTRP